MFLSLFGAVLANKKFGDVILGNWSATNVFTTAEAPIFDNYQWLIRPTDCTNHMVTEFNGEEVRINISYVDFSGNITYDDNIYYFDFKINAPPMISSEIDFHDFKVHASFASYTSMRVIIIDNDGNTETLMLNKHEQKQEGNFLWNNKDRIFGALIMIIIPIIFQKAVKHMQIKEFQKAQAAEKAKKEKELEDVNNNESNNEEEEINEEEEKSTSEQQNVVREKADPVPDENGKIKVE